MITGIEGAAGSTVREDGDGQEGVKKQDVVDVGDKGRGRGGLSIGAERVNEIVDGDGDVVGAEVHGWVVLVEPRAAEDGSVVGQEGGNVERVREREGGSQVDKDGRTEVNRVLLDGAIPKGDAKKTRGRVRDGEAVGGGPSGGQEVMGTGRVKEEAGRGVEDAAVGPKKAVLRRGRGMVDWGRGGHEGQGHGDQMQGGREDGDRSR